MLLVLAAAGVWGIVVHELAHRESPPQAIATEWKRYSPSGSNLSLELPGEPLGAPHLLKAHRPTFTRQPKARLSHSGEWEE